MGAQRYIVVVGVLGLAVAGLLAGGQRAQAQMLNEQGAAMGMNDTLNGASTGPSTGGGFDPIGRTRNAQALANGNTQTQMQGLDNTGGGPQGGGQRGGGQRGGGQRGGGGGQRGGAPGGGAAAPPVPTGLTTAQVSALAAQAGPTITVISGTRVYDAITNELIDDAIKKKVPEADKAKYYDDGTNGGDLVANDGVYTNVVDNKDPKAEEKVIGLATQKVKEQLITALRVAENYDPIDFYGYEVMSTDRQQPLPRNQAWRVVKDPQGGLGMVLAEVPIDKPIEMPNYREKMKEKDSKVKDDWAKRFLREYRKDATNLSSEFFPVYIPLPPRPPSVVPPAGWVPFADPGALTKAQSLQNNPMARMQQQQQQQNGGGMNGGGMNGGGMNGGGMNGGGMNSGMSGGRGSGGGGRGRGR